MKKTILYYLIVISILLSICAAVTGCNEEDMSEDITSKSDVTVVHGGIIETIETTDTGETIEEVIPLDRREITNLRLTDPITNKTFAEVIVSEIPKYTVSAMNFKLADTYATKYQLNESAGRRYRFDSAIDGRRIEINIDIYESAEMAQEVWLEGFDFKTRWDIPAADSNDIVVGDVASGWKDSLDFIRGNIHVKIEARDLNNSQVEFSIVEVAQEIDAQIIKALEEAAEAGE